MTTALVLAGHGSHISPHTAGVIWRHVDRLRALGVADEVTAAFWKEPPSFHRVFETLSAQDITVIPIFTAQGYFTQTVIPTEMGLTGAITHRDERVIRYARTPNEHPELARIVRQRVEVAREEIGATSVQIAIAVIGHSTRRNPESRQAAEQQVALLRSAGAAAEVIAVYLDDSPAIPDVYTLTSAPILICVPFFVAAGSHTTLDIPARLGLQSGERIAEINGRKVIYTAPVGVEESLTEVILDLAREAGTPLRDPREGSEWDHFPAAGRSDLIAAVKSAGEMVFGELVLTRDAVYAMVVDINESEGQANPHPDHFSDPPMSSPQRTKSLNSPAALRSYVRGEYGAFRPLPTTRDLPTDWRVGIESAEQLHAVIETIYPGAVADWSAARRGSLGITDLDQVAARQTGMFRTVGDLSDSQRCDLVAETCGNCVLRPLWSDATIAANLPCMEACNLWLSRAVQQLELAESLT